MPRRIRDTNLETRDARRRLKPRGEPYWKAIERAVHVGYRRRDTGAGTWTIRVYAGNRYRATRLGDADDFSDADGKHVLTWWEAVAMAREHVAQAPDRRPDEPLPKVRLTVADALDEYVAYLEAERKTAVDARYRDRALIRPVFGAVAVADLSTDKLRRWHRGLVKQPLRLRTRPGSPQQHRFIVDGDDEALRRRRASANRSLTVLKAALNRAWRDGKVPSDAAWRRVEPFEDVERARVRYLTVAEARRLTNACPPDFRKLVQAALATGARYGELGRLVVCDFDADAGTLAIRVSKSGKPRHVVLTDEGRAFFAQVCAGRAADEPMLLKADGSRWLKSHQNRPTREACAHAKITPRISFHILRHTWASLAVMNGVPLLVVAKNLGHADTRMVEKFYGHLAPSYVADAIRKGAPRFGFKADDKVTPLATPRQ